jgi:phage host-nuclease inhibitor protein Gam
VGGTYILPSISISFSTFFSDLALDSLKVELLHTPKMRPLTEEETQTLFKKLAEYCGSGLKELISMSRLQKSFSR